jgi:hypothetical protein
MTKTTRLAGVRCRVVIVVAAVVGTAVLGTGPLFAQSKSDVRRFSVAASVGIARPSDQAFRKLYGSLSYPLSIQADYGLYKNLLVFSEYEYVRRTGKTQIVGSDLLLTGDPIKFRMHTFGMGLLYAFHVHRFILLAGGGAGLHCYSEAWEAAGLTTTGNKAGFVAQGGGEHPLSRHISLIGRVEYSRIAVKAKSASENDANLGRLELLLGLSFHLGRALHR